jgi:phosphoglycolate phosphatase-like HAD superfamily hydrolase/uridine kinase
MRDIGLVAFDLDGTLFRTESATVPAVKQAFRELGAEREPPDAEIKGFFGELHEVFMDWVMSYGLQCSRQEAARRIDELELENVRRHGSLFPGAVETLKRLREMGCAVAICSNGRKRYVSAVMDTCELWPYFDTVRFRRKLEDHKPGLLRRLLEDYEGRRAILVGDRHYDFEAAAQVGCPSVAVRFGYGREEVKQADAVIDSLPELVDLVTAREAVFEQIAEHVAERKVDGAPLVIGVSGIDNAGKTTFAKGLSAFLGMRGFRAQRIHLDRFHHPRAIRQSGPDEIDNFLNRTFDFETIIGKLLEPARAGNTVDEFIAAFDIEKDECGEECYYHIDGDTVVVLEGLFLERPEVRRFLDFSIWLDISLEECLKRAEKRDIPRFGEDFMKKYHTKYIPAQKRFMAERHPKENADLVVDNSVFLWPKILS